MLSNIRQLRINVALTERPTRIGSIVVLVARIRRPKAHLGEETGEAVHTLVLSFVGFRASDARYQNYYRTDPSRPFCQSYIDPKLAYIRQHYSKFALPG